MANIWDYHASELKKSATGKILLLERSINFGPKKGEKISLSEVKKNWSKLNLFYPQKKLFELLIWGKTQSSPKDKKAFWKT